MNFEGRHISNKMSHILYILLIENVSSKWKDILEDTYYQKGKDPQDIINN
jgi:hypothetical protein